MLFEKQFLKNIALFLIHRVIAQPIIVEVSSKYLFTSFVIINHLIRKIIVQTIVSIESAENLSKVRQGQWEILNDFSG